MRKVLDYLKSVRAEMRKVTWPSKDETKETTVLVVVFALVLSLIVWCFDQVVGKVVGYFLY